MTSDRERRAWLFPPARGRFRGLDLSLLDPADEDERGTLIEAEHPELARAIDQGHGEIVVDGQPMNPRLHLVIHQVVANQLWADDPPQAWQTAERLIRLGYDRHEILHMIGSVVAEDVWNTMRGGATDPERYGTGLAALPESWERMRAGAPSSSSPPSARPAQARRRPKGHRPRPRR